MQVNRRFLKKKATYTVEFPCAIVNDALRLQLCHGVLEEADYVVQHLSKKLGFIADLMPVQALSPTPKPKESNSDSLVV